MFTSRLLMIACALVGCDEPAGPVPPVATTPLGEPPAHVVGGFTAAIPSITLAPGQERQPCWVLPLVPNGPSRIVGGAVLRTPPGLHHGNITTRPKTGEGVRPCPAGSGNEGTDIINGGMVLFASSTQISGEEWYRFPDGHGYRVNESYEIVARMHFLNPTDQPLTVAPTYEWFTIDESTLVNELGPFVWMYNDFSILPRAEHTVTAECYLPNDHPTHIVTALPHMHKLGRALTAAPIGGPFDGQRFLDSTGFDPEEGVLVQYEPPVDLTDAEGLTFSCSWQNTFDKVIVDGVGDNEMCMVFGYAWPVNKAYSAIAQPGNCQLLATPPPS
jgi:hypothetical protein